MDRFLKINFFEKAVKISHFFIEQKIHPGERVVDATCGNGKDTVFLSRLVGVSGKVYAFDIQERALQKTKELLAKEECVANVELICAGHQNIEKYVQPQVSLILFNLGYLPCSDRRFTTQSETTLEALKKSLTLLDEGGIILMVIYPGHEEGMKEKRDLYVYAQQLPQQQYNVFYLDLINQTNHPPVLLGIEFRGHTT